eukprot:1184260-Prorocentrum_minimum.AAC.1
MLAGPKGREVGESGELDTGIHLGAYNIHLDAFNVHPGAYIIRPNRGFAVPAQPSERARVRVLSAGPKVGEKWAKVGEKWAKVGSSTQ